MVGRKQFQPKGVRYLAHARAAIDIDGVVLLARHQRDAMNEFFQPGVVPTRYRKVRCQQTRDEDSLRPIAQPAAKLVAPP